MQCPECSFINQTTSRFCSQCGARLRSTISGRLAPFCNTSKNNLVYIILTVVFLIAGVLAFVFFEKFFSVYEQGHNGKTENARKPSSQGTVADQAQIQEDPVSRNDNALMPSRGKEAPAHHLRLENLLTGQVIISSPWETEVAKLPAVVLDDGWIALPAKACIGGDTWKFQSFVSSPVAFSGGLWAEGDIIGLWQLEEAKGHTGPPLGPWSATMPLQWLSLQSNRLFENLEVMQCTEQGIFMQCRVSGFTESRGLFLQDNQVVGFTFGESTDGGFLLAEDLNNFTTYESSPIDFYNRTFAGGREEQFARGLAMGRNKPLLEQMTVLAGAFRLTRRLTSQETPPRLVEAEIIKHLRFLVSLTRNNDLAARVVELFSPQVLMDIGDPGLARDIVYIALQSHGYEYTIRLTAEIAASLQGSNAHTTESFYGLLLFFYQDFLRSLLKENDLEGGWAVFDEVKGIFPDDQIIQLLGVELALAEEDWQEAEQLLYTMEYSADLTERMTILSDRISELKSLEGKIVIRFQPGDRLIPLDALLNSSLKQHFFVDTGSSFVTIPTNTAVKLGIEIDANHPLHHVSTAGGVIAARQVTLSSIELGGWIVEDVKALVIDIPGKSNAGLLGLNFLNRFRMDLDTNKGILVLAPK